MSCDIAGRGAETQSDGICSPVDPDTGSVNLESQRRTAVAPSAWRDRLVGAFQINIIAGILLAYSSRALIYR